MNYSVDILHRAYTIGTAKKQENNISDKRLQKN